MGWMQTWLVHMRDPVLLVRELGPGSFLIGKILFIELALDRPSSSWKSVLLTIDIVNVACGYLSFLLLGWQTLKLRERFGFWKIVLFTPVYWIMMSAAAWRAVWQL